MTQEKERDYDHLFFWSWGHDLNGKTLAIENYVKLIRRRLDEPNPNVDKVNSYLDAVERICRKITEKSTPFDIELVSLNTLLVQSITDIYQTRFIDTTFELDLDPSNPQVKVNPLWIRRVIEILIDNAVAATRHSEDKLIEVRSHAKELEVEIEIRDTGEGISQTALSELFTKPMNYPLKASGRGLYIARLILELYDGQIMVKKTSRHGTIVNLNLPTYLKR